MAKLLCSDWLMIQNVEGLFFFIKRAQYLAHVTSFFSIILPFSIILQFCETLKTHVKLILHFTKPHAITYTYICYQRGELLLLQSI
jgi:hypothetical protein